MSLRLSFHSRLPDNATPLLFLVLGLVYASWTGRIPALREALDLDVAQLGVVLLGGGVGAVAAFPLSAWLVSHFGPRLSCWLAGIALLLILPAVALAPSMGWLIGVLFALGAAFSCLDVAINALGAAQEKRAGHSIMSLLHAWFCVGALLGALLAAGLAHALFSPLLHFVLVTLLLIVPLWWICRRLPDDRPLATTAAQSRPQFLALPHGALVALGVIGFCGAMTEGSIAEWSGVFVKDHLGVGDGAAPLAFAAFSGAMLIARLRADPWKDRYGARRIVATGSLLAACGIVIAVFAPLMAGSLIGFALAGVGVASVFPFVFSAAGQHGALALAGVATMSYSGGLIGPPLIGFLAHSFGMQAALVFVAMVSVVIALAAHHTRLLDS